MKGKIFKIIAIVCCIFVLTAVLLCIGYVNKVKNSDNYAHFDTNKLKEVYSSLTVLDEDGNPLQEAMYHNSVKQVPLATLNKYTYMAFVAVEDKRFYQHDGIDVRRVLGAILNNAKSGSFKEGASTISQQLIKNTHLDNTKSIERKLNEMMLAKELEKYYTKEQILEIYLNTIYFGRNAYGIENAANVYFDKSARDLTISESAILAGMIKAPNTYAPDKNIDKCNKRRNTVLQLMLEQGVINQEEYGQAVSQSISYTPRKSIAEKTYIYYALKEACQLLNMSESQLLSSGYTIKTYCNQEIQQSVAKCAKQDCTTNKNGEQCNLSCIIADKYGHIQGYYSRGEGCDTPRQAGSTLKPIAVYTPALNERIITQATPILDEETNFNGYIPQNLGGYNGWTTIKQAVTRSLNVPAVKTLNALTIPKAQEYLSKMGIFGEQNLSLALGNAQGGLSPIDLVACYTTLANCGSYTKPSFVESITSSKGTIYKNDDKQTAVFSPSSAFLMTDMLVETAKTGTARKLADCKFQVAAKTGTVGNKDGNTDALVVGYTTENIFQVWHNGELSNDVSGATAPTALARKLLNGIYQNKSPGNFLPPQGVLQLDLDKHYLENEQQMRICNNGQKYWFDYFNKPMQKIEESVYNYTIKSQRVGSNTVLSLPNVDEGCWKLYVSKDDATKQVELQNNSYLCQNEQCSYFAVLQVNGKDVYRTPMITVSKNVERNKDDTHTGQSDNNKGNSFLDYWYWKR